MPAPVPELAAQPKGQKLAACDSGKELSCKQKRAPPGKGGAKICEWNVQDHRDLGPPVFCPVRA